MEWWKRVGATKRQELTSLSDKLSEVRDLFDNFDSDASGSIGKAELSDLVEMLGTRLNDAELQAAVEAMDGDGSGEVEFDELFAVRDRPGRSSALSISHSKSVLYGAFVWARGALNRRKRMYWIRIHVYISGPGSGGSSQRRPRP